MKVVLDFSTASMRMVMTRRAVRNISMKRPWTIDVPWPRVVATLRGPGNIAETRAAATMPPSI